VLSEFIEHLPAATCPTLAMAFKLIETAQKRWFRLRGYKHLADVISGVKFVDGIKQTGDQQQNTEAAA
jgi:membrane-bound lytic murein transglycosylase MltF